MKRFPFWVVVVLLLGLLLYGGVMHRASAMPVATDGPFVVGHNYQLLIESSGKTLSIHVTALGANGWVKAQIGDASGWVNTNFALTADEK